MVELEGIKLRDGREYDEALKDKKIIDELKATYDITTKDGVDAIFRELQSMNLNSQLGRRFDDEIYDLREKYKRGEINDSSTNVNSSAKNKDKSSKVKGKTSETKEKQNTNSKVPNPKTEMPDDPALRKAVLKEIKKRNARHMAFVVTLGLISFGCLAYFGNYMIKAEQAEREAKALSELKTSPAVSFITVETVLKKDYDEEIVIPEILDEYKVLYNKNTSLIGWIKIADTKIDYPVMQTVNNDYYLKHNFEQKEDANGCIFLDKNCDVILGNDNYIIYGHHMKSGKMFGTLVKYANEDFYKQHKYIQFDTIYEKGTYEVMYVFRSRIFSSDEITFKYYQFIDANSEAEFNSAMEEMEAMSLYSTGVKASYGDQLLTLSTCDYQETNGRFAVVARKIY